MKELVFFIFSLCFLASCSSGPSSSVSLDINLGNLISGTADNYDGGVVVYGTSDSLKFAMVVTSSNDSITLPYGAWSFTAIAWDGGTPLQGDTRCATETVTLDKSEINVSLTLSQAGCDSTVSDASYFKSTPTTTFQNLEINVCDPSDNILSQSCSDTSSTNQSVKVILNSFNNSSLVNSGVSFNSLESCIDISSSSVDVATSLALPVGFSSGEIPYFVSFEIHSDNSCTSKSSEYNFENGLLAGSASASLASIFDNSNETEVYLVGQSGSSSINVPVTAGLQVWLDASDSSSVFQDVGATVSATTNSFIKVWKDKSGNGYDVFSMSASQDPTYKVDGVSGNYFIEYDGVDDVLALPDGAYASGTEITVIVYFVHYNPGSGCCQYIINKEQNTVLRTFQLYTGASGATVFAREDAGSTAYLVNAGSATANTPLMYTAVVDSSGGQKTYHGSTQMGVNAGGTGSLYVSSNPTYIGNSPAGTSAMDGGFFEILIYDRALTASEIGQIESYLQGKW